MKCNLCPKNCNADRKTQKGGCRSGDAVTLCRIGKHFFEEPCISGCREEQTPSFAERRGSGTVFFGGCNLHCVFCQNRKISEKGCGVPVSVRTLADVFLYLQDEGACNVNLVSPSHFSDRIAEALALVKHRLTIPVVYNTNSYEKVDALRKLDGLADVYLPDVKFCDERLAAELCGAADYFAVAAEALAEMRRQQPRDVFADGLMQKGVLVRHLVLPGHTEDSKRVLDFLAGLDKTLHISLMAQYFPTADHVRHKELNRRVSRREYDNVLQYFFNVGLKNGYAQEAESAVEEYVPQFDVHETEALLKEIENRYENEPF